MAKLAQKLTLDQLQTKWAAQLNPILAIPMLSGIQLNNVVLASGSNVINHLLQRQQQGWIVTDQQGAASLSRSAPFNNLTLTLTASAACTVNLWCF
jgi:hypothetical protein